MLAKRIIPCLDVKDGQTVKGTNFVNLRQAGDPVELGRAYSECGADELVFLDITASHEGRKTFATMVERVAATLSIPFTVGGGINEISDVDRMLSAGADKVSINSAALRRPELIDEITNHYGSQVCVVAIDARQEADGTWQCYVNGGRVPVGKNLFDWAHEVQERGAGEILFTSMNHDGVKNGFANEALRQLADNEVHPMPQPTVETLKPAPKIFKEDMHILWDDTAENIYNHIRGLSPYPAAFALIGQRTSENDEPRPCVLKIFEVEITDIASTQKPGTITLNSDKKMLISTKSCEISVKILQIEGKKRMKTEDFLAGFRPDNYTRNLY